jgi:hypothetical protein
MKVVYAVRAFITLDLQGAEDVSVGLATSVRNVLRDVAPFLRPGIAPHLRRASINLVQAHKAGRTPCSIEGSHELSAYYTRDPRAAHGPVCMECFQAMTPEARKLYYSAFEPTDAQLEKE